MFYTEGNIVWDKKLRQWVWQRSGTSEDILSNRESPHVPDDYVWYIPEQRYVRIQGYMYDDDQYYGGAGWRHDFNLHAIIPDNYIYDVGHRDWVMFLDETRSLKPGWRNDNTSTIPRSIDVALRRYGRTRWEGEREDGY